MRSRFQKASDLSSWRLISLRLWDKPRDPTVYGTIDVDMGRALEYLDVLNSLGGPAHVTVTHLVIKAIAKAIAENPECNALVSRRAIYLRETVDVYCQVATGGGNDLSGVKIRAADRKPILEIASELARRVANVQGGSDAGSERTKRTVLNVPRAFLGLFLRAIEYLSYDLRLDLGILGIEFDQFGSAMVSNVGGFGVNNGWAPLVPATRVPIVLLLGEISLRPAVRDGKVVSAPCMTVGCTFDHRVLDGFLAGKMSLTVRKCLEDPLKEIGLPSRANSAGDRLSLGLRDASDNGLGDIEYTGRRPGFVREEDQPA